jgi:hypothetical protein
MELSGYHGMTIAGPLGAKPCGTRDLMRFFLALLLGSAIVGFLIGLRYRVFVLVPVGLTIAVVAAIAIRDFHFVTAVAIVFGSLLVNQIGYLIGVWLRTGSITEQSHDRIARDC